MLKTLHISNYALIDVIDLEFGPGLNIITGETGAGKSIMLGALSLLLGGRADTRVVADNTRKSVIEAKFEIAKYSFLGDVAQKYDIDWDGKICILRREITPAGRSRAFVNDTPVNLSVLSEIACHLIDIHSQHSNMLLSNRDYQLELLDSMASAGELLAKYREQYAVFRDLLRQYHTKRKAIESDKADREYIAYQLEQLDQLNPVDGEQDELEHERDLLTNMSLIKGVLTSLVNKLGEGAGNVVDLLREAENEARSISRHLADGQSLADRLSALRIEARDLSDTFADLNEDTNADENRLDYIVARLDNIYMLESKHHVDNVEALIVIRDRLRDKLNSINNSDEILQQLARKARKARAELIETARLLTEVRTKEAEKMSSELRRRAMPLGMSNLVCDIHIDHLNEPSTTGMDCVDFRFAFNKNQTPASVSDTASGGEISRLMLTLKSMVADRIQLPSIIFDEVDTGVSGDVADRMGQMMRDISENIQVIAITHLPQVASKGRSHFKVYKEDDEHATHTYVRALTDAERVAELAVMLSGNSTTEAAIANARELLGLK